MVRVIHFVKTEINYSREAGLLWQREFHNRRYRILLSQGSFKWVGSRKCRQLISQAFLIKEISHNAIDIA